MTSTADLAQLNPDQLRSFAAELMQQTAELTQQVALKDQTIRHQQVLNEKLTHELAILKRHRFGRRSETMNPDQVSLLDELTDADIAAIEAELAATAPVVPANPVAKQQPKRKALPPELPRTLITHEPDNTQCQCGCQLKRIGEDVSEKLDYTPGEFTVERHVRGKWACESCETLIQAPVPAQVIDKGIPTSGPAGSCTGRQVRRSPAAVPAGNHLCTGRLRHSPLYAGGVGGALRCCLAASG